MAVNYNNTLKTTRMTDVLTAIDAGLAAGSLEIGTAGMAAVLVTITLAYPCGTVGGTPAALTFSGTPLSGTATGSGTAAAARIKDSLGTVTVDGLTVSGLGSGANIEIDNTTISSGQTVNLNSGVLTHG